VILSSIDFLRKRKKYLRKNKHFERINQYLSQIILAGAMMLLCVIIGIVGFMSISGYNLMDAFYMTVITISTVGYGEIQPLGFWGRMFASFLILTNISIFTYGISILSRFLLEGDLRKMLDDYNVYQKIQKLKNHTIICGYGRHGREVLAEMIKSKNPYVVVEPDPDKVKVLRDSGYFFIEGDATQDHTLKEAGIEDAKSIVITFGEDAFNVYTVLTARQLNPKLRIVTRASSHEAEKKLYRAGANHVVMSEVIGGVYMATLVFQPRAAEFFQLLSSIGEDATIQFKEVMYKNLKSEFKDKSIKNLDLRTHTGVNIIALKKPDGKYAVNPDPETVISKGISLIVLGDSDQMEKFENVALSNLDEQ
jgi:voltage-gated potassium channel